MGSPSPARPAPATPRGPGLAATPAASLGEANVPALCCPPPRVAKTTSAAASAAAGWAGSSRR
eukprot:6363709-Lingulodinium_polyedra.AAC.1